MQRRAFWIVSSVILGMLAVGCSQKGETPDAKVSSKGDAAAATPITLTKGDEKAFAATLEKLQGKVVLVDYWATWCGPCVASFPHTVETGKKYAGKGLSVVTISFDSFDDENQVKAFLSQHDAGDFENLLSSYDGPNSDAADAFKVEGFPTLRLFDKSGKMVWETLGAPNAAEQKALEERIERLLSAEGA